ncbi:YlzJ-like family protein [Gracilibacillus sp. YIM 98692]|uniref:YlzJ-like family protein n=1 Tax=Gracilibacillus sp. YIM 98692 TaxID=2663532 RepID=UPI0013D02A1F|nr:YlzJ-like family protein [Gracilibacillus sp. YIM 98692]
MILYTPLSYEDIHQPSTDEYQKYQLISLQQKQCIVEKVSGDKARIVQLLSTNPNDFLNQQLSPGSVISISDEQNDQNLSGEYS